MMIDVTLLSLHILLYNRLLYIFQNENARFLMSSWHAGLDSEICSFSPAISTLLISKSYVDGFKAWKWNEMNRALRHLCAHIG